MPAHFLARFAPLLLVLTACAEATSDLDGDSSRRASISVLSRFSSSSGHSVRLAVAFVKSGPSCQEARIGDCTITDCHGGAWSYADPGVVHAASEQPAFSIETTAGAFAQSGTTDVATAPASGQVVTFSGSGAEVPAFDVRVEYPAPFVLESPLPSDTTGTSAPPPSELGLAVTSDSDLELTLSRATPTSRLVLVARPSSSSVSQSAISCDFDASSGRVVVPSAVLVRARGREFELITAGRTTTEVAGWPVTAATGSNVLVKTKYGPSESSAAVTLAVR